MEFLRGWGWRVLYDQNIQRNIPSSIGISRGVGGGGILKKSLPWGRHGYFLELTHY